MKTAKKLGIIGKDHLNSKNYRCAGQCFSASLQLIERITGDEAVNMRKNCGLSLAHCEFSSNHYRKAIARLSEVINEISTRNYTCSENSDAALMDISETIGNAFYKRAHAFEAIDKPQLALLDLETCKEYLPDDVEIYKAIAMLEEKSKIVVTDKTEYSTEQLSKMHNDFIADCQLQHPRKYFTKSQIKALCKPILNNGLVNNEMKSFVPKRFSNNNNLNHFKNVFDMFPADLKAPAEHFDYGTEKNGKTTDTETITLETMGSFAGFKPGTVRLFIRTYKFVRAISQFLQQHKMKVVALITLLVTSTLIFQLFDISVQFRWRAFSSL